MSLGDRTGIEPLPEAEWDRIEEAVFAELGASPTSVPAPAPRRVSWRAMAVGAALAVAAAGLLAVLLAVLLGGGSDAASPVAEAAPALAPTRVESGAEPSRVSLGDVDVTLASGTALVAVGSDAQGWVVALERGSARFAVPPREQRPEFFVQAGAVRVEVVGTVFEVAREPSAVAVSVTRGRVRVVHAGQVASVGAGDSWRSHERVEGLDSTAAIASRRSLTAPAPSEAAPSEAAPSEAAPSEAASEGSSESARATAPRGSPASPGRGGAEPSAQATFERASRLERSEPADADRLYGELARGSGPWASAALFARARLATDRGALERGARLARLYLARFPGGVNAPEARALLAR